MLLKKNINLGMFYAKLDGVKSAIQNKYATMHCASGANITKCTTEVGDYDGRINIME